jgi:leader peptidase (prepilin peptidase)/N-methyltransferase
MDSFILLFVFILGLVIGSFLNVVIFRLETEDKIVNSRSKCLSCGHQLSWKDLFPVFSFIFLRGKCRYCGRKISWQYPLVEIATGVLFVLLFSNIFYNYDFTFLNIFNYLSLIFIFSALVVVFVFDLRHYIIPDEVIYPAILVSSILVGLNSLAVSGVFEFSYFIDHFSSALLAGGFFLFLVLLTKGKGMGGGDIKLGFLMGLVLGFPNILLALFIAFISGAIIGLLLMAMGKKKMKSMVPFGPFLIFGFLVSYFYGAEIIDWYLNMFLM